MLIGSYAREDASPQSDIDILTILRRMVPRRRLTTLLPKGRLARKVSILPMTANMFRLRYKMGGLFIRHVVDEGKLLYDDGLYHHLTRIPMPDSRNDSTRELETIRRRVELYSDPSIFNGLYLDFYVRIYRLATETMIISSALRGNPIYNKHEALKEFIRSHPTLKSEATNLARLEPFYSLGVRHSEGKLPFSPVNTRLSEVRKVVSDLERVVEVVQAE